MKALILLADGFEDLTVFIPWYRLQEEQVAVTLAAPHHHTLVGKHGYHIEPDFAIADINSTEFDMLLIPGGAAPERLRLREEAVDIARTFLQDDRTVVTIGHGLQVLISAGALDGRTVTCSAGIRDDVRAAGGRYRDEAIVVDGNLITCRGIDDLPQLSACLMSLPTINA